MYACGLRISEAATLQPAGIDRARMVLRIIGKGNKERLVPLPRPVLTDLEALWRQHRNRTWIFPNNRGDTPHVTAQLRASSSWRRAGLSERCGSGMRRA